MRFLLLVAVAALVAAPAPLAAAPKVCGTAKLQQIHPVEVPPWHGVRPGGRGFPTVGEQRDFWTYDLSVMPPKNVKVPATCRGVGQKTAVWVADDQWGGDVQQADVDAVVAAMEASTPRTADSGIVQNNEALFGAPPKFHEGDPEVTLLVYDIAGYNGYTFDGFFRREDLDPFNPGCQTNPMLYCSNELGMVHVNGKKLGDDYMIGVIAHEFEHLAHFGKDPFEENWLDESMAELAMAYSGYEDPWNLEAYIENPALPLIIDPPVHYGACFLFGAYLHQRLGTEGIQALVADSKKGVTSIDGAVPHGGFAALFGEFAVANVLDDPTKGEGAYGYDLIDPEGFAMVPFGSAENKSVKLAASALKYVQLFWQLEGMETYLVTVQGDAPLKAHAVHLASGAVFPLALGTPVELPVYDDPTFILALANPDPAADADVSLQVQLVEGTPPVVEEPVVVEEEPIEADVVAEEVLPESDLTSGEEVAAGADATPEADVKADDGKSGGGGCTTASRSTPVWPFLFLLSLVMLRRRQAA